eukprot:gene4153-7463_t
MSDNLFRQLHVFPSNENELTLGEVETKLLTLPSESNLEKWMNNEGALYPNVKVPLDINPTHYKKRIRELFLNVNEQEEEEDEKESIISDHSYFQTLAYHLPIFQLFFSVPIPEEYRLHYISKTEKCPIRTQDWNSKSFILAVVLQDNSVYFFNMKSEKWSKQIIRHDFHVEISTLKWRPNSEHIFAVGCKYGICVWDLNKRIGDIGTDLNSNGICIFLKVEGFESITSLDWSPCGNKLAVGSLKDHRILLWTLDENKKWNYKFITKFDGGITNLGFSPNGNSLVSFTLSNTFRIWNTNSWKSEKWYNVNSPTTCFAWSPNSNYLLYSELNHDEIFILTFNSNSSKIEGKPFLNINLSEFKFKFSRDDEDSLNLCGDISEISLDQNGERLVVSFENSNLLAVMRCDFNSIKTLNPVSPLG